MNPPLILLIGYYGKGNFGDDILLRVAHALALRAFPNAQFSVVVDGDAGDYVPRLLGPIEVLKPGRHGHFDMIIHGGGGVFFDFKRYGLFERLKEYAVRLTGFGNFIAAEKIARKLVNKPRTSTDRRLGLGIGLGSYSAGSPRLRMSLPILADFDALWLRDSKSVQNAKRFSSILQAELIAGSDLAFLTEHWLPPHSVARAVNSRPKLGIILRDWPQELGGLPDATLQAILAQLAQNYDLTGFVFDRHADPKMTTLLAPYRTVTWQPETMDIDDFVQQLAAQNVLLTSRFHGAICGACLGVASVIVAIEPKLAQVATMLPQASVMVAADRPETWAQAIAQALTIPPEYIAMDVAKNRAASEAALKAMESWLQ